MRAKTIDIDPEHLAPTNRWNNNIDIRDVISATLLWFARSTGHNGGKLMRKKRVYTNVKGGRDGEMQATWVEIEK